MAWSPDQEIVIFATGNDMLVWMSKEWEILAENPMDSIPLKQQKQNIAVLQDVQEQTNLAQSQRTNPRISWRTDGKLFTVNSQDLDGKRWLRIWERGGNLLARNEPTLVGLESPLFWRFV